MVGALSGKGEGGDAMAVEKVSAGAMGMMTEESIRGRIKGVRVRGAIWSCVYPGTAAEYVISVEEGGE